LFSSAPHGICLADAYRAALQEWTLADDFDRFLVAFGANSKVAADNLFGFRVRSVEYRDAAVLNSNLLTTFVHQLIAHDIPAVRADAVDPIPVLLNGCHQFFMRHPVEHSWSAVQEHHIFRHDQIPFNSEVLFASVEFRGSCDRRSYRAGFDICTN